MFDMKGSKKLYGGTFICSMILFGVIGTGLFASFSGLTPRDPGYDAVFMEALPNGLFLALVITALLLVFVCCQAESR
jgi:hypothetical protein